MDVITVVEAVIKRYGAPKNVRSDYVQKFIVYAFWDWLEAARIKTL